MCDRLPSCCNQNTLYEIPNEILLNPGCIKNKTEIAFYFAKHHEVDCLSAYC